MDELHRRFVERVRDVAAARAMALSHVADFAGVGRSHFWAVMGGRSSPTLEWMGKIARVLGVDVVDLLARSRGRSGPRARA